MNPLSNEIIGQMRVSETGATRNVDTHKNDYEGFLSPTVIQAFGDYMHSHRKQADGNLRDSDNWQKGLKPEWYMKSMWRHFLDVWSIHRDIARFDETGKEIDIVEALCATLFNVQGMLHEELKKRKGSVGLFFVDKYPVTLTSGGTNQLSCNTCVDNCIDK